MSYDALRALCEARKSTREFDSRPVAQELVEQILAVAQTAPYASGRKNWEVVVVDDAAVRDAMVEVVRRKVDSMAPRVREHFRGEFNQYAENFSAFGSAPLLLVPAFRMAPSLSLTLEGSDGALEQWERDNFTKSIAGVGILILLAAESLGLAGCIMTGPLLAEQELAGLIGAKRGRSLGAIIPIGYRKETTLGR